MIQSMTGFGAGQSSEGHEAISVEIRSVNGRFCEVKPRLPRELGSLEAQVVKTVKDRLARGTVDVYVRRSSPEGLVAEPKVDGALLAAYARALKAAGANAGLPNELSVRDLVLLEGVATVGERPPDLDAAAAALSRALDEALESLVSVRKREGKALAADLSTRLGLVRGLVKKVESAAPAAVEAHRARLKARVEEALADATFDPARLEQEIVLFADRSDVAEELTRLNAHLDELERLLEETAPAGRRMDFLLQELNREINTTGSKSQSVEIAQLVVELKAEAERLREQVQNVE